MEIYEKMSKTQIQQVKDEHSNHPEIAEEFSESLWMNRIGGTCKIAIDIPPQFSNSLKYNATLGHKVNHDFKPNSKYLRTYDSARFGLVMALKTLRDVKKGEEFLVDYQYTYNQGPKWYKELLISSLKKNPEMKSTHAHLLHNVDLDHLDNQLKDTHDVMEQSSINNDIGAGDEDEVPTPSITKDPKVDQNLLGTTYWY